VCTTYTVVKELRPKPAKTVRERPRVYQFHVEIISHYRNDVLMYIYVVHVLPPYKSSHAVHYYKIQNHIIKINTFFSFRFFFYDQITTYSTLEFGGSRGFVNLTVFHYVKLYVQLR